MENYPLFWGVRGSEGGHMTKKFFTKICPKRCSRNLQSLGGLRKAVFWQLKFLIEGGGTVPPPVAGGPLIYQMKSRKVSWMVSFRYLLYTLNRLNTWMPGFISTHYYFLFTKAHYKKWKIWTEMVLNRFLRKYSR